MDELDGESNNQRQGLVSRFSFCNLILNHFIQSYLIYLAAACGSVDDLLEALGFVIPTQQELVSFCTVFFQNYS